MKKIILAGVVSLMGTTAMADGIGVSMALFDDNFLTVLRNGMDAKGKELGVELLAATPFSHSVSTAGLG